MLSENQVVRTRKALEWLYTGKCTITASVEKKKPNGATSFTDEVICTDQPCRLSHSTFKESTVGEAAATISQIIRLHIAPEIVIPEGSKIVVSQVGATRAYRCSGTPAMYDTHQEVVLIEEDRWA